MTQQQKAALTVLIAALLAIAAILAPSFLLPRLGIGPEQRDFRVGERLTGALPAAQEAVAADIFRPLTWDELVPRDWDPLKDLKNLNLQNLADADPRAMKALESLREIWNKAPVRADLNGARVRIPGFVIPLERQNDRMTEFLLVPYFGACIHTPPPPSNQIIHAIAAQPVAGFRSMDPAWISGELETIRSDTTFGAAGYRLKVSQVEAYKRP